MHLYAVTPFVHAVDLILSYLRKIISLETVPDLVHMIIFHTLPHSSYHFTSMWVFPPLKMNTPQMNEFSPDSILHFLPINCYSISVVISSAKFLK